MKDARGSTAGQGERALAESDPEAPDALHRVLGEIAAAERAAGRSAGSVKLVAVSKTVPAARIAPAIAAGQRRFGENRVQEARAKWPGLRERAQGIELHLVGALQTNKAREAVGLFDVIHSLDRARLARALAEEIERAGRAPRLLVQVNTGDERQKAGVSLAGLDAFVAACRRDYELTVEGLMCVPPFDADPAPHFRALAEAAARLGLIELSMGMSGDFVPAIEAGATLVRIGTALFGGRGG